MNIGKEIAIDAKKYGLCAEWYKKMLSVTTYKQLAEMYFDGDDWSMEKDFPSLSLLRQHKGAILPYGLVVDSIFEKFENNFRIAFFGNTETEISYTDYAVGNVIVRHQSKVKIKAKGNAKVFVNLIDEARVEVEATENAEVIIYNYGQQTNYSNKGNVIVKKSSWER